MSQQTSRLDVIQILRGVAALMVCLSHIATTSPVYRFPSAIDALGQYPNWGVNIFFLISGFVVPWSLDGRGYAVTRFPRYLVRRLVRLDPPYLVTLLAGIAMAAYRSQRGGLEFPYSWSTVALHVGYLTSLAGRPWIVPVFWTLGIEFQFYILMGLAFPLLARFVARSAPTWRSTALWLIALGVAAYLLRYVVAPVLPAGTWISYQALFAIGIGAFLVRKQAAHWTLPILICMVAANRGLPPILTPEWAILIAASMLIVWTPNVLAWTEHTWAGRAFGFLGTVSYSLYLTHVLILGHLTSGALARGWLTRTDVALFIFFSELALCLLFASVFYRLIERRAVRWSHAIEFSRAGMRRSGVVVPTVVAAGQS